MKLLAYQSSNIIHFMCSVPCKLSPSFLVINGKVKKTTTTTTQHCVTIVLKTTNDCRFRATTELEFSFKSEPLVGCCRYNENAIFVTDSYFEICSPQNTHFSSPFGCFLWWAKLWKSESTELCTKNIGDEYHRYIGFSNVSGCQWKFRISNQLNYYYS